LYQATKSALLWELVGQLEREGIDAWRNANAPHMSLVDALALEASSVQTEVTRHKGGNVSVTVFVHARQAWKSDYWFFMVRKGAEGGYHVTREA
jgi:hypothetical protein